MGPQACSGAERSLTLISFRAEFIQTLAMTYEITPKEASDCHLSTVTSNQTLTPHSLSAVWMGPQFPLILDIFH